MGEPLEYEIEERVAVIMPNWSYWGNGIVLVSKNEWQASEKRINSVIRQLSRSKKQIIELRKSAT